MAAFQMRTASGKDFGEVASALQKSCRRGLIDDAMYWMVDLYDAGFAEYVWRRLFIIASEDVGLANPTLIVQLNALYEAWKREQGRPDGGEARLFITQATMAVAASEKSRDVDNVLIYHFCRHREADRAVPDYAIDKHTAAGKAKKRAWDHFWEVGSQLAPEVFPVGGTQSAEWRGRARETLDKCRLPADGNKMVARARKQTSKKTEQKPADENGLFDGA